MANMHYCRFENTYSDFVECLNALANREKLSELEEFYAKNLYRTAQVYIEVYEERKEEEENEE